MRQSSAKRAPVDRQGDRLYRHAARAALNAALDDDPVRLGRALLVTAGLVVTATVPLQNPTSRGWLTLTTVSTAMTLVLLTSWTLPWSRLPRSTTLLFPGSVAAALAALGLNASLGAPYAGLLVLCFAYTGLTQSPATNLRVLPSGVVVFIAAQAAGTGWTVALTIRLLIAASVWLVLSQLLAALTARQRLLTRALRAAADTDLLTGLPNRRHLLERLERMDPRDVLVLLDLDHFKQLNDTRGHAAGDLVLADFGRLLRTEVRTGDFPSRYGGEEFVLLLPDTTAAQASAILDRLHHSWASTRPPVTFSAGFALSGVHATPSAALSAADQALYAAKAAGRDCHRQAVPVHSSTAHRA